VAPAETEDICPFHRQSLIVPVSSAINALATLAWFPYLVTTCFGSATSKILAFRLTWFIPVRKSLMELAVAVLAFFDRYLRILSVSMKFVSLLLLFKRNSSSIGNCAMTSDSFIIRKMNLFFVLPRHWIDNLLHLDFLCSSAERRACKNFSGLTSYFTERKARYSPIDGLDLMFLHLLPLTF
jgi:hypothetical protein